jgi:hypothetical protein
MPGTVISSSKDSHRKAKPFSRMATSFSCSSVAVSRIRKRSAGKPMILPSVSSIKTVRFSAHALMAEVRLVPYQSWKSWCFSVRKSQCSKTNFSMVQSITGGTPLFRASLIGSSQNLHSPAGVSIVREKGEAKRLDSEHRRHGHLPKNIGCHLISTLLYRHSCDSATCEFFTGAAQKHHIQLSCHYPRENSKLN